MADVNNIVITGTIFDKPRFFGIASSSLTVVYFTLACNKGTKKFDPKYMFGVSATMKKHELQYICKGARLAVTGHIANNTDEGIEKTIIHGREIIPLPVEIR